MERIGQQLHDRCPARRPVAGLGGIQTAGRRIQDAGAGVVVVHDVAVVVEGVYGYLLHALDVCLRYFLWK